MSFCKICNSEGPDNSFWAREMMIGLRDEFEYFQCGFCNCIQIKNYPTNIGSYYPSNKYYSFDHPSRYFSVRWKNYLKGLRDYIILNTAGYAKKWFVQLTNADSLLPIVSLTGINKEKTILDVGCGAGVLLYVLKNAGYDKLLGIDPFIDEDLEYENGLKILKEDLFRHEGLYDIIMMHHSLEHMPDQHDVFARLNSLLKPKGKLLIRIPVVAQAWDLYKTDWVQLDAPRHYFIHSKKSIQLLGKENGFSLAHTIFDSSGFQFWGSELYKRNIPLTNEVSAYFSNHQLREFKEKSDVLNRQGKGDQAAFIFDKI